MSNGCVSGGTISISDPFLLGESEDDWEGEAAAAFPTGPKMMMIIPMMVTEPSNKIKLANAAHDVSEFNIL